MSYNKVAGAGSAAVVSVGTLIVQALALYHHEVAGIYVATTTSIGTARHTAFPAS